MPKENEIMKKQYISFSGKRKKPDSTEYENIEITMGYDDVLSVALLDNRDKHPCVNCNRREECDSAEDVASIEYECDKLADYIAEGCHADDSFIEIATKEYVYLIPIKYEWNWYKDIFKKIKDRKSIDIDDYIAQKNEQKRQKQEEEHIQWRIGYYKRNMVKLAECRKRCYAKTSDGHCAFGFNCVDFKPQEKCYPCSRYGLFEDQKEFITKYITKVN